MNRKQIRRLRFTVHLLTDLGAPPFGVVTAIILAAVGAPTWAWLLVGFAVWTWASNRLMAVVRQDRRIGRFL